MLNRLEKFAHIFLVYAKTRAEKEGHSEESGFEKIKKYIGQPNIFFHMSNSDKVWGVNVRSEYNTPAGIYLYPLNEEYYNKLTNTTLPFQTEALYVWIFKVDGNIIRSSSYNNLEADVKKLKDNGNDVDKLYEESKTKTKIPHPLSQLFYIIYNLSGGVYNTNIFKVTKLFKSLGYDGIFDDAGLGIIHKSEPVQAVIFSGKNCKPIDLIKNESIAPKVDNVVNKINKIDNQRILEEIIFRSKNPAIRKEVVKKIDDNDILNNVVNNDKNENIRSIAISKIKDQNFLKDIAKNNTYASIRIEAIRKIEDQNFLKNIVNNDIDPIVQEVALLRIIDKNILNNFVKNSKNVKFRYLVIQKIEDKNILNYVAKKDKDTKIRIEAIRKIDDQDVLYDIFNNDEDLDVRREAFNKITDKNILDNIYDNDKNEFIQEII